MAASQSLWAACTKTQAGKERSYHLGRDNWPWSSGSGRGAIIQGGKWTIVDAMVSTSGLKPSFPLPPLLLDVWAVDSLRDPLQKLPSDEENHITHGHTPSSWEPTSSLGNPHFCKGVKAWPLRLKVGLLWRAFSAPKPPVWLAEALLAYLSLTFPSGQSCILAPPPVLILKALHNEFPV